MANKDKIVNLELSVLGMDCPGCATGLERELDKIDGVETSSVNYYSGKLNVSGKGFNEDSVLTAVEVRGFTARANPDGTIENADSNAVHFGKNLSDEIKPLLISSLFFITGALFFYLTELVLISKAILLAGIFIGGMPIARKSLLTLKRGELDINSLMLIAVIAGYIIGEYVESAVIIILFSLAELMESMSLDRSRKAITNLISLKPETALLIEGDDYSEVPVKSLHIGSKVLIKPGMSIPVDGKVVEGISDVDQSAITGESLPVSKEYGNEVFSGSINGGGSLHVLILKEPGDSTIDRIIRLVEQAQLDKPRIQTFIEKFARYYTPSVVIGAVLVALIPPLLFAGIWSDWIYRALAMLVISCPCALVISTPVTIISALSNAARNGVLVKSGAFLESISKSDVIAFDKTGTLTSGKLSVREIVSLNGADRKSLLQQAASVESHSEHLIAKAIVACARHESIEMLVPHKFVSAPGRGAMAILNGSQFYVGSHDYFEEQNICNGDVHPVLDEIDVKESPYILVGNSEGVEGIITFNDPIRQETISVIQSVEKDHLMKTALLTGDREKPSMAIAEKAGIEHLYSELLPGQKVSKIKELQNSFGRTVMIGDGINDAPALAAADIGVAMGESGTDAALETADIVLLNDRIDKIPWLLRLSRKSRRLIIANITAALGIKSLFMVFAATGHATLWMAVLADMGVSLAVIFNGMRALKST